MRSVNKKKEKLSKVIKNKQILKRKRLSSPDKFILTHKVSHKKDK